MQNSNQSIRNRLLIARLPAMPQVLVKLIDLCQRDQAGMGQLAKLISHDAAMTAKILSIANGSAYSRSAFKLDLMQSLSTLGIEMIKTLVINESIFQTFNSFSQGSKADLYEFWMHALNTALIARELAKKMSYPQHEEAYLAGLLHDVGRLALLGAVQQEYSPFFTVPDDEDLCAIETSTLGITHAEAGALLVEQWNLDSFLADSIQYHHESYDQLKNAHPLIRIVCMAHLFSSYKSDSPALQGAPAMCGINDMEMSDILITVNTQIKTAITYFGINPADGVRVSPSNEYLPKNAVTNLIDNKLAEEVRNIALVSAASKAFSSKRDTKGMLESMTQAARVLFNFEDMIVLLQNLDTQVLAGFPIGEQGKRLSEFLVPLGDSSIIAQSVSKKQIRTVFKEENPVGMVESQLLRALGTECLIYLPLTTGQTCLGVLVGGLSALQAQELGSKERLLSAFSAQAVSSLQASDNARNEIDQYIAKINEVHREASLRVAHEVNNPLSIIKNYLGVLDYKLSKQEPVAEELTILNEEIDRVGRIVGGLAGQQYSHRDKSIEVNGVLNDVVRLFSISRFLPDTVSIVVKGAEQHFKIKGESDPLKQILLNLIKNAVEALPKGGKIEVRNNGRMMREGRAYIELCISDTGPGIPADVLANLFSTVHSSKHGENRGLGLNIVQNLVSRINGFISCRSGEWGTKFDVLLPAYDESDLTEYGSKQVIKMK
jgi:putative nucleotidyltransferase with HDIG domain